jgi:hypothetical protein
MVYRLDIVFFDALTLDIIHEESRHYRFKILGKVAEYYFNMCCMGGTTICVSSLSGLKK